MNCAWCGAENDGSDSHGICDACMLKFFHVDPASLRAERPPQRQRRRQTGAMLSMQVRPPNPVEALV